MRQERKQKQDYMHIVIKNLKKKYLVKGKNYPTQNRDRFSLIVQKVNYRQNTNEDKGMLYCKGTFEAMYHKLDKNSNQYNLAEIKELVLNTQKKGLQVIMYAKKVVEAEDLVMYRNKYMSYHYSLKQ